RVRPRGLKGSSHGTLHRHRVASQPRRRGHHVGAPQPLRRRQARLEAAGPRRHAVPLRRPGPRPVRHPRAPDVPAVLRALAPPAQVPRPLTPSTAPPPPASSCSPTPSPPKEPAMPRSEHLADMSTEGLREQRDACLRLIDRSEERRVGKECRSRGEPYDEEKEGKDRRELREGSVEG